MLPGQFDFGVDSIVPNPLAGLGIPTPRRRTGMTLTPEEEQSLIRTIGSRAASGLSSVANALDLPGSMARDVLTLNNPFDQLLDPFGSTGRINGREMLTQWGLTNRNDPNRWEMADVYGFGAELATDPLAWFPPFAVSKGGKLLGQSGKLDELLKAVGQKTGMGTREARLSTTLDDALSLIPGGEKTLELSGVKSIVPATDDWHKAMAGLDATAKGMGYESLDAFRAAHGKEALGGSFGFQVPFTDNVLGVIPAGDRAKSVARGIDQTMGKFWGSSVGRGLRAVFDRKVKGIWRPELQPVASDLSIAQDAVRPEVLGEVYQVVDTVDQIAKDSNVDIPDMEQFISRAVEYKPMGDGPPETFAQQTARMVNTWNRINDKDRAKLIDTIFRMKNLKDAVYQELQDRGLYAPDLFDDLFVDHFPRYAANTWTAGRNKRVFDMFAESTLERNAMFEAVPEGRAAINDMAKDAMLTGDARLPLEQATVHIAAKYNVKDNGAARKLAKFFANAPKDAIGSPVYGSPIRDLARYLIRTKEATLAADHFLDTLANFATLTDDAIGQLPPSLPGPGGVAAASPTGMSMGATAASDVVPLEHILRDNRFVESGRRMYGVPTQTPGVLPGNTMPATYEQLAQGSVPNSQYIPGDFRKVSDAALSQLRARLNARGANLASNDEVLKFGIPKDIADEVGRLIKGYTTPTALEPVLSVIDQFQSLFKAMVTSPFPSFNVRNFGSGQFQNWITGLFGKQSVWDMDGLVRYGKAPVGAAQWPTVARVLQERGLTPTDDNALGVIRELMFKHELIGRYQGAGSQTGVDLLDNLSSMVPGREQVGIIDSLKSYVPRTLEQANPLNTRGVLGREETKFAPLVAGEKIGYYTEAMNRGSAFIEGLKQGWDDTALAAKIKAAHIDYSGRAFSGTENAVFSRLAPFYKFSSRMAPFVLRELIAQPGGRLAQTIRAMNAARGETASTPDYISETASIPLGQLEDGSQRYLTGFGLMFEDPLSFGGGGARGAGLELLSRLNPALKGLLEWSTNQSFFQKGPLGGRPLDDLDPTIGRLLANVTGQKDAVTFPGSDAVEWVASNSPLARVLTTARQATDHRKWNLIGALNFATGVRTADISPASQDAILRERAMTLMGDLGSKEFTRVYFPKEKMEQMSPADKLQALQLQALQNMLAERAKQRKLEKAKGQQYAQ